MKEPVNGMLMKRNNHEKRDRAAFNTSRQFQQTSGTSQQYIRRNQDPRKTFRSAPFQHVPNIQCHYCENRGHTSRECLHRKHPDNTKFIWYVKSKQPTRTQQLKPANQPGY